MWSRKSPLHSIIKNVDIIEVLKKKTKFSKEDLEALNKIYDKLTTTTGIKINSLTNDGKTGFLRSIYGINRAVFRQLLQNTFNLFVEDLLIERIFSCWDKDSEGTIRLEFWILGLNIFLHGNFVEKMEFCFKVYDLNNDGFITKDEIYQLLKNCLIKQPSEEDSEDGVRDLSEMILKKLDVDHDGKVSLLDYVTSVQEEPLLLEVFGKILPTVESNSAFLLTIKSM